MLTIDVGNTHIKWALWRDDRIDGSGSFSYSKQNPAEAFEALETLDPQGRIIVACVGGLGVERALESWAQGRWSVRPEFLRSTARLAGVTSAYADPAQLGVDRWAAMLGARSRYRGPLCIIDAGTAVTVDLLDAGGRHQGGRILPGLRMMRDALIRGAAGIGEADGTAVAFADNTADAVSSGTLHMLQAALLEICKSARRRLGDDMKIIITGGLSAQILSLPGMPVMQHEPDLVLAGLYAAAQDWPGRS